jgi:5,10-methylene-tetrahydrofolate dehydrogenase/methenyl tetrahydrofolate cyclohydrolase
MPLIDGKAIAAQVREEVRADVERWRAGGGRQPGLATVLVGDDPASAVYVGGKQKACAEAGIQGFDHRLPGDTEQAAVEALLAENATVTVCHSRTHDLGEVCRRADVLVAAVGRPRMIRGDWIKPGATVIDVGINRVDEGLVGDVDFASAVDRAGLITPVPGGVGPMTIAMLLRNTLEAARAQGAGEPDLAVR